MKKNIRFILSGIALLLTSCAIWQSAIKSTFPYTAIVTVARSSAPNVELSVTGTASSFAQDVKKDGNGADMIKDVRVVSAKIESKNPDDFNIGNFSAIKVYLSKADSTHEVMVASRTDITPGVGNSMVLDIDNSSLLDTLVLETKLRIRMVYRLRNHIDVNTHLKLVLGLGASPKNK